MKIGTAISHVATPIARALNMPCIDPVTHNLRPDSTCAKVAGHLDAHRWGDALYDFIWRDNTKEEITTMEKDWLIIQHSGVKAKTWQEAMSKVVEAEVISVSVQQRQMGTVMIPAQPAAAPATPPVNPAKK
jgi:hypothetical protein